MENKKLMEEVRNLISEVERTKRYSMSRVYGLYNKVFEKNETAQSCASCLIRKVDDLRGWLKKAEKEYTQTPAEHIQEENKEKKGRNKKDK